MSPVDLRVADRIATLTVDRPPLNVLDLATLGDLEAAVQRAAALPELQLLVVRGAGERAFSAGVAVEDHAPESVGEMLGRFHGALRGLRGLLAPSLAVVNGHCLGGGLELALACDLVLAAEGSRFGQPEIRLGCFPPFAAAVLPGRIGAGRTLELLATGRTLEADEARALGLVTWLEPAERLEERLAAITAELTASSAAVARLLKRAVAAGRDLAFDAALAVAERIYTEELPLTRDMHEGLAAFAQKREPRWKHE